MHAQAIVGSVLGNCLNPVHVGLRRAIEVAVSAGLQGACLSLSQLALSVAPTTSLRHRVKRIDRLLSNAALHRARGDIYRDVAAQWLAGINQVLIVVDWSDATTDQRWHLLRASVAVDGRSVTLYEEVHPQARLLNSPEAHQRFLGRLARLLPAGCRPIIMTDAWFRSRWFAMVEPYGWHWLGRIRGKDMVSLAGAAWQPCRALYSAATTKTRSFGQARYVRSHPTPCRLVLVKRQPKGRVRRGRKGQCSRGQSSLKAARRGREPWLLACSHGLDHLSPEGIVALYAQRMRIEQSLRDLKSERQGLGLHASRSGERLEVLLLIGHLVAWVLRLIGECAQQRHLQLQFQCVAHLNHKEISVMTLARRVVGAGGLWLKRLRPGVAIAALRSQAQFACTPI